jgi:hypothetical protein
MKKTTRIVLEDFDLREAIKDYIAKQGYTLKLYVGSVDEFDKVLHGGTSGLKTPYMVEVESK